MNKALRFACLLIFSICFFTCIPMQAKGANVSNNDNIENTYRQKDSLIDKINELQQKQDELKSQYNDLSEIAKFNIEQYHEKTTSMINFYSILITVLVAIAIGMAGILFPIWINNKNEKLFKAKLEESDKKIKEIDKKTEEIEKLKEQVQKYIFRSIPVQKFGGVVNA